MANKAPKPKYKVKLEMQLALHPGDVLDYIKGVEEEQGHGPTRSQIMDVFGADDWSVQDVLSYLQAQWKVWGKPYSSRVGKMRVPVVRWTSRDGKPRQRRYPSTVKYEAERKRKRREGDGS